MRNKKSYRPVDILKDLGALALASRLKRLSDRLMKDVSSIYNDCHIDFKARWFTTIYTLSRNDKMSVTDLAAALSISHTAVNQLSTELIHRGWVHSEKGSGDERLRFLFLSPEGKEIVRKLKPIWDIIQSTTVQFIRESNCDILNALNQMESQLTHKDMYTRISSRLRDQIKQQLDILEYKPAYKKYFQSLNYEWLTESFFVEPADEKVLNDPRGQIIQTGGAIFFARFNGKIVGTCALIRHKSGIFELTKMAVTRPARGMGIGKKLADTAIHRARDLGADALYLQTSSQLVPANRLYRKIGFRKVGNGLLDNNLYSRKTYTMRLILK